MRRLWLLALAVGCTPKDGGNKGPKVEPDAVQITDEGPSSGYQDYWFGSFNRGRGNVVADWDGDGDYDLFSGNPGGNSFLIRNLTEPGGALAFEPWQVLSESELLYGGVAADFDGDGDPDLFVATGANDGFEPDRMYRNDWAQGAPDDAPLVDISDQVDVLPTMADGTDVPNGSMGANAFDADGNGTIDLFVSNYAPFSFLDGVPPEELLGVNQLYLNAGGWVLDDRAYATGMVYQGGTRHSAVFDFDRDGDMDLYENNFVGAGALWRSRLVEDGALSFELVNDELELGETDLTGAFLNQAMCSFAVDLDQDGWEDLLLLHRGKDNDPELAIHGHQIFMNQAGQGFVDVLAHSDLSAGFADHPEATDTGPMGGGWGVMGCQIGDVNLDGFPDVFVGTGVGGAGDVDRLFVSRARETVQIDGVGPVVVPMFDDWTERLDFPAELVAGAPDVPYPYRTHGSAFADYDGDGIPELGVHNGGPASFDFLEPNRLWKFHHEDPRFVRVSLRGDGVAVNPDGAGTRVRLVVERDRDGASWELHQVLHLGTGFGAQNEPVLTFGLGDGDRVTEVEVSWPDGLVESVDPPDGVRAWMALER